MSPFDISDALDNMTFIVDTREQETPSMRRRIAQTGLPTVREKLDCGDYSARFSLNGKVVLDLSKLVTIERKMNLDELCMCFGRERKRFANEFQRAKAQGVRVYLLIEDATWEMAYAGKYRSQYRSTALIASMAAWMSRYDCRIVMCNHLTTGKLMKDILYREGKERLEAMCDADSL